MNFLPFKKHIKTISSKFEHTLTLIHKNTTDNITVESLCLQLCDGDEKPNN